MEDLVQSRRTGQFTFGDKASKARRSRSRKWYSEMTWELLIWSLDINMVSTSRAEPTKSFHGEIKHLVKLETICRKASSKGTLPNNKPTKLNFNPSALNKMSCRNHTRNPIFSKTRCKLNLTRISFRRWTKIWRQSSRSFMTILIKLTKAPHMFNTVKWINISVALLYYWKRKSKIQMNKRERWRRLSSLTFQRSASFSR